MTNKLLYKLLDWYTTWLARRGMFVSVLSLEDNPDASGYVGDLWRATYLARHGIVPQVSKDGDRVCSIGFCEREQKWYGWSHRAIHGFGVGSTVDNADHLCASSGYIDEYIKDHPEADRSLPVGFTAATLDDAKRMAIAFADAVG